MSLSVCPECGSPETENQQICSECGFPLKTITEKKMPRINKKIILCITAVVLVVVSVFGINEHQKNGLREQLVTGGSWKIKYTESVIAFNNNGRTVYSDINNYGITEGIDARLISGDYKIISKDKIKIGEQKVKVTIDGDEIFFEPDIKAVLLEAIHEKEN